MNDSKSAATALSILSSLITLDYSYAHVKSSIVNLIEFIITVKRADVSVWLLILLPAQ